MTDYKKIFRESLDELKNDGNYRIFADLEKIAGNFPQALNYKDNSVSEVTVWCSNDYLGMSQNDIVIESMIEAVKKVGAGSGGTRNISGTNHYHVLLERELCYLHQKEAALLFNSGYLANQATLSTLGKKLPDCVFFSDEKNHASMIQGMRNSGAKKIIFEHNNINDLENEAKNMMGKILVTHQPGPAGREIKRLYIEEASDILKEFYLSCLVDRETAKIAFISSTEGGMDIEKVAKDTPKKITGRQDIVKESKKKPEPPTRALNDPRDN